MWNPSNGCFNPSTSWHHKRKMESDSPMELMPPVKMHITEEKMVSQLNGIHLSSSYTSHGSTTVNVTTTPEPEQKEKYFSFKSVASICEGGRHLPTLQFSEELKSLSNPMNPIIPDTFINKFNTSKSSTALVLWQPPVPLATLARTLSYKQSSSEEEEPSTSSSSPPAPPEDVDIDMNEGDDNNNNNQVGAEVVPEA